MELDLVELRIHQSRDFLSECRIVDLDLVGTAGSGKPVPRRKSDAVNRLGRIGQGRKLQHLLVAAFASDSTFEQVIDGYLHVAAEMADRRRAIVTTAKALTDAQRAEMVKQLEWITGSPIELSEVVDPTVLGGALINLGDEVIDSYIKLKMQEWEDYCHHLTQWERDHTLDC